MFDIFQFCFFQNEAQPLLFAARCSEKAYLKEKRMMPALCVLSGGTVKLDTKVIRFKSLYVWPEKIIFENKID